MIADFAIHQPDKEDGGIPNPHFHVLCPIRPIEESGKWGFKQRRVYRLDEVGNRIMGEDGKPLFDAVPTTDWGSPETLEHWREAWAAMVNAKFEEKGLTCRIDHRSYERQGLDLLPTVHEGVAVRQMEAKGIATDKGDFNRWIRKANSLLRDIHKQDGKKLCDFSFYKEFKRIVAKIGRPDARPHDLRHTAATVAIASGADIKSVQSMLGHSAASFTLSVYAHTSEKMMKDTARRIQHFYDNLGSPKARNVEAAATGPVPNLDALFEALARLVETQADTGQEAAQLIRQLRKYPLSPAPTA